MSRREQIKLTHEEQLELLEDERVVVVSTLGPRGWPHSMPLWYTVRDGEIWIWTFAKSQKVLNLERDPRCTLLVESGEQYHELRGLQIEAQAEIVRETDRVLEFGKELTVRYAGGLAPGTELDEGAIAMLESQAPKRVAIRFDPVRTASWDHRKLGGVY